MPKYAQIGHLALVQKKGCLKGLRVKLIKMNYFYKMFLFWQTNIFNEENIKKNVLTSSVSNSFAFFLLYLRLLWGQSCPDKRHFFLSAKKLIVKSGFLPSSSKLLFGFSNKCFASCGKQHHIHIRFSIYILSFLTKKALAGAWREVYLVVTLHPVQMDGISFIWARREDYSKGFQREDYS